MAFEVGSSTQRRFDGYGPSPLPSTLDQDVAAFVDGLRSGGPPVAALAIAKATEAGRGVLRAYAERMASLAVRQRDAKLLERAIVAVVVGGLSENDHEALLVMPVIEDSAKRIGVQPPILFEGAAEIVGHPATTNLVLWLMRKPEDRELSCMGYAVGEDGDGFRYIRTW